MARAVLGSLFGTDGVRGRFGVEPIVPETILKLGWAVGSVFSTAGHDNHVLIGKDTRVSGYVLESALESGLSAAGMNVTLLGPMPSPGIAYLTRTARASMGIVVSASHNPYVDNGIKIFSSAGTKLDDALVAQIDEKMRQPLVCVDAARLGKIKRLTDAHGRYIEFCKSHFPASLSLSSLKIVVDCANGAAYQVAPRILNELDGKVTAIANQPDGFNINRQCGSTCLQNLIERVRSERADIGIALDGDADRVLLVDQDGVAVNGDQILFILARHRQQQQRLQGGVVGTVMSNLGLQLALDRLGIPFSRTQVGDRHVYERLVRHNWLLGGEPSGHIICLDKSTTGDGIVAALEVLQVMLETGKPLSGLIAELETYPQKMINVDVRGASTYAVMRRAGVMEAVRQAESELGDSGRVVLRPSGTEPVVRVMIEGKDSNQVNSLIAELVSQVKSAVAH